MRNRKVFFSLVIILLSAPCWAATVYLKNGAKIEGKIVERTDQQLKLDVKGITLTYFSDEVDRVEEDKGQSAVIPKTPVPSTVPQKLPVATSADLMKITPPETEKVSPQILPETPVPTTSSSGKQQLIWQLIEVSGARANMNKILADMLTQAPPEEMDKIKMLFNIDEIILQLVPIYDKYFNKEELQQVIDFYNSAGGRKLLSVTPQITQESMESTLNYFKKKMESIEPAAVPSGQ